MAATIKKYKNIVSLRSIYGEKDLKPIPGVTNIQPPPQDGKCMCCKRHISELKPYGKGGDPFVEGLVGDFDGALLVKVFRPECPMDEEAELTFSEAVVHCDDWGLEYILDWEIKKRRPRWLCRDCVVLDEDEYFKNMEKMS